MSSPSAIAAVGASAGGIEALRSMFGAAKPEAGICYVVLLHQDPKRDSALTEIIARDCALPVDTAVDGGTLLADHVYVVPIGCIPTVVGGKFALTPDDGLDRAPRSINALFSSLALDAKDRAIGVVLSGSGSDGTLGLKAIKEWGGLTIAQGSNGSAPQHASMPDTAIAAGTVDLVLPVEHIPARLVGYARGLSALDGSAIPDQPAPRR